MLHVPLNIVLRENLLPGTQLMVPYPQGKQKHHFFAGSDYRLSAGPTFYRYPKDFLVTFHDEGILLHWRHERMVAAGNMLHLQPDGPAGDYHRNTRLDLQISGLVATPLFMVDIGSPMAADPTFYAKSSAQGRIGPLPLKNHQPDCPRNVILYCEQDNSPVIFSIEGQDIYGQIIIEQLRGPRNEGFAIGKKAFAAIRRIEPNQPFRGEIGFGTGSALGLPVFLPGNAYVMREIVNEQTVSGGLILPGAVDIPTATSGDRRGTYTPPDDIALNGINTVRLLLALLNPGNIGTPDYDG